MSTAAGRQPIQAYGLRLRQALKPDEERDAPGQVVITDVAGCGWMFRRTDWTPARPRVGGIGQ